MYTTEVTECAEKENNFEKDMKNDVNTKCASLFTRLMLFYIKRLKDIWWTNASWLQVWQDFYEEHSIVEILRINITSKLQFVT